VLKVALGAEESALRSVEGVARPARETVSSTPELVVMQKGRTKTYDAKPIFPSNEEVSSCQMPKEEKKEVSALVRPKTGVIIPLEEPTALERKLREAGLVK
jgi:hypothetical protein